MPDMWIGKLLSLAGVILLLLAVSPMGDFWDPRQSRLANAWRWIRNPRPDLATPVTVDPIFLYGGGLCAIIGILLGSFRLNRQQVPLIHGDKCRIDPTTRSGA
jgi:hypothetical protein